MDDYSFQMELDARMSTPAGAATALDAVEAALVTLKAKLRVDDFSVQQLFTSCEGAMLLLAEYLRARPPT
jgi:hypothetical protein